MSHMSHVERVGMRKLGDPEGFAFFKFTALADGTILMVGGKYRLLKSGKRKGERTWNGCGGEQTIAVAPSEVKQEEERYSAETGKCSRCLGEGKTFASWSATDGVKHRACSACSGSGEAGRVRLERG